jgi:hypothetical protein
VQHDAQTGDQERGIERAPAQPAFAAQRIEQEHERSGEHQMGAAEDERLGRTEGGDIHVIERHRDRDGRHDPS